MIQDVVCAYFGISIKGLLSNSRTERLAECRQVGMYLCKTITRYTGKEIANAFNLKHGASVIYAVKYADARMDTDRDFKAHIVALKAQCMEAIMTNNLPMFSSGRKSAAK